jgi:hypothetical protein
MDLDPDKLDAFFEASEDWNSALSLSNSLAYISQFGYAALFVILFLFLFLSLLN